MNTPISMKTVDRIDLAAPRTIQGAIDNLRYEAIQEFCQLMASHVRSTSEAAFCGSASIVKLHLDQVRLTLIEARDVAKGLGKPADDPSGQPLATRRAQ